MFSDQINKIGKKNFEKLNDILFYSCIASIIGLAIFFRSQGYFDGSISFWVDEAHWGDGLITNPLINVITIRPVGYMFLTKLLINISKNEIVFRLISYLSSLLTIFLVLLVAKHLWRSKKVILLMLFIIAFNPILITFAKEFKPYALEFFIHTCFIYLSLQYIQSKKEYLLYAIIAFAVFGIFFCYNIVFIFPAIFLILLFGAYSSRNYKKLALIIATILLIFLQLFLMYYFIFSKLNISDDRTYWGGKYDVFYLGSGLIEQFKWIASKYVGLVEYSGRAEVFWPGASLFKPVIGILLLIFHFMGIVSFILQKKYSYLLLFFLPIVTVILINSFGVWPYGPIRVNLFLLVYFLILTVNGFNYFINKKNRILRYSAWSAVVAFFFILQLPINFQYYNIKPRGTWSVQSDVRNALEIIIKYEKTRLSFESGNYRKVAVIADEHAFFSTRFYLTHHPNSVDYKKSFQQLNMKYIPLPSGVKSDNKNTIINRLRNLSRKPQISQGETWLVIGKPTAIDEIELILNKMPERIVYKNKLSYASLVVLLRV